MFLVFVPLHKLRPQIYAKRRKKWNNLLWVTFIARLTFWGANINVLEATDFHRVNQPKHAYVNTCHSHFPHIYCNQYFWSSRLVGNKKNTWKVVYDGFWRRNNKSNKRVSKCPKFRPWITILSECNFCRLAKGKIVFFLFRLVHLL